MSYRVRLATGEDEPFLWEMLYYAAHVYEEEEASVEAIRGNAYLVQYVRDWGRATDVGSIAIDEESGKPVGAAWMRLLVNDERTANHVGDGTPELAIAVAPDHLAKGVGTLLLRHVLAAAKEQYEAVVLSVRVGNPARRLYERMGFCVCGEMINRVGTASVNMRIDLV